MGNSFGEALALLRREADLNQRALAAELRISQALLSHYENGTREPGLPFVCRVCDYFGVSADFILGRDERAEGAAASELDRLVAELTPELREAAILILRALPSGGK